MKTLKLILFLLFVNSCASMANQPMSDKTTQELSEQTPKPSWTRIREKYPTFPGGDVALNDFIETNMQYPQLDTITGKRKIVVVQFTVAPTGELADVKIKKPLSPEFDAEALRIVKSMPNWIPGEQNGQLVAAQIILSVRFKKPTE